MCKVVETRPGYVQFIAMFSWEHPEDMVAQRKLFQIINQVPEGIDEKSFTGFYLTGHRTMIFIGQASSSESIQMLSSMATYGTAIKPQVSLAVDVNRLVDMLKKSFSTKA